MSEYVDWPDEREDPVGLAVILPGRNYPATMPLLTFAGRVAAQHGWRVRAVSWQAPDLATTTTIDWVGTQLAEALAGVDGHALVIGKSLGTCAAAETARRGHDAIWLTPLLHLPEVAQAMSENPGRQLLVGGTRDPAWDLDVARSTGGEVVQVDGADHGMFTDDAVETAALHLDVTRAVDHWLRALD